MIDLASIVEQLDGELFKQVDLAGGLDEAVKNARGVPQSPAAFVLPLRDVAQPNRYSAGAHAQQVASEFGVLIGVRNLAASNYGRAIDELKEAREAAFGALVGWQPDGADDAIEFRRGSLRGLSNGVLWWLDEFGTSWDLTA